MPGVYTHHAAYGVSIVGTRWVDMELVLLLGFLRWPGEALHIAVSKRVRRVGTGDVEVSVADGRSARLLLTIVWNEMFF